MARKRHTKQLKKPTPIIIGAGITEQYYFQHLNSLKYFECKVRPRFNLKGRENACTLSEKIKQALTETEGKVICVFDYDVLCQNKKQASEVNKLFQKYSDRVMKYDSMPCFEYWILLHFEENYKTFKDCSPIEQQLKKHLSAYQKSETFLQKDTWVKELEPNRLNAISRASQCRSYSNYIWTNVYEAFK